ARVRGGVEVVHVHDRTVVLHRGQRGGGLRMRDERRARLDHSGDLDVLLGDLGDTVRVEADVGIERNGGAQGVQHDAGEAGGLVVGSDHAVGADLGGAGGIGRQEDPGGGGTGGSRGTERGEVVAADDDVGGAGARQPRGHAGRLVDRDRARVEHDGIRAGAHATSGEELLAGRRADVNDVRGGRRRHGDSNAFLRGEDGVAEGRTRELDGGGRVVDRTTQDDGAAGTEAAHVVDGHAGDGEAFTDLGSARIRDHADHELGVARDAGTGDQRSRSRAAGGGDGRRVQDLAGGQADTDVVANGTAEVVVLGGGADGGRRDGGRYGCVDELVRVLNGRHGDGDGGGKGRRRSERGGNGQDEQLVLRHVELTPKYLRFREGVATPVSSSSRYQWRALKTGAS